MVPDLARKALTGSRRASCVVTGFGGRAFGVGLKRRGRGALLDVVLLLRVVQRDQG